ncbi:MAG: hypothetical protein R3E39_14745 [Anaerolineae bacterium]
MRISWHHNNVRNVVFAAFVLALFSLYPSNPTVAQSAPCGIADNIGLPVPDLVAGYDDFGLFRRRFGGNHTGVDLAFDRWGDPVQAAARGQVTLSNTLEWNTEKGVVVVSHAMPEWQSTLYGLWAYGRNQYHQIPCCGRLC